jgi:membrane protease YdiL (CAAX protease family)
MIQAFINFGLSLFLPLVLTGGERSWSGIGMTISNVSDQIRIGFKGFSAAVIPMAISMVVTIPFRPPESQNSLLKLLQSSPDSLTISLVTLTAVLSAPLVEELLFRVILQGWLATLFPAPQAITFVAVLFGLVHGWRDGLALLPLAFILGYVFHRRHSFLAVVMIHALFNATMLVLQLLNPQVP